MLTSCDSQLSAAAVATRSLRQLCLFFLLKVLYRKFGTDFLLASLQCLWLNAKRLRADRRQVKVAAAAVAAAIAIRVVCGALMKGSENLLMHAIAQLFLIVSTENHDCFIGNFHFKQTASVLSQKTADDIT